MKLKNPKTMLMLGNVAIIAGSLSLRFHVDALTGFFYGAAIGLLGLSAHLSARGRSGAC